MQYVGGKQKSGGQHIAAAIKQYAKFVKTDIIKEPLCGGLSVTSRLEGFDIEARDACVPLITLYQKLQKGWVPPTYVSRETWEKYKENPDPHDPMTAFVGFGCSRSGDWFSSFIEDYKYTDRRVPAAFAASSSLIKKIDKCKKVKFRSGDYRDTPIQGVMYCDIPYLNTVQYPAVGPFDHAKFWTHVTEVSKKIPVLVSELVAVDGFVSIKEWSVQQRLATSSQTRRVEKIFVHERWSNIINV